MNDPASGYAWFGSAGTLFAQGSVVKVAFEPGSASPRRVGAGLLNAGETPLAAAMIDVPAGYAVFGGGTKLIKVALGSGEAAPARAGGITLPPDEHSLHCAMGDAANGLAWFGTSTTPGQVVLAGYSQKGFIKGSRLELPEPALVRKFHFYSHRAAGSVRLAIYARHGTGRTLRWQSASIPNTSNGAWIIVPANLALDAGVYDLAWQVDATADVPGYIGGAQGDGFRVPAVFGSFPATLTEGAGGLETTDETWATYVSWMALPQFIDIRRGAGTITLVWTSCPGIAYQVQRSDGLLTWTPASPLITATGPTTEWTEATAPNTLRQFYRLAVP